MSKTIRCSHCNLINFSVDASCKRCKNPLPISVAQADNNNFQQPNPPQNQHQQHNQTQIHQPNHTQIRETVQQSNPQIQPNRQSNPPFQQNRPTQQPNQQRRTPPRRNQQYQQQKPPRRNAQDITEYQSQNQHGFQQWQQNQGNQQYQQRPPMRQTYPPQQYVPQQIVLPSVFRQGNEFVVHQFAQMPDRCVTCNDLVSGNIGESYATQKYRWHNPLVYIALISPLIYLILSLALSKSVKLNIPMCDEHLQERKTVGNYLVGGGIMAVIAVVGFAFIGYGGFAFLLFLFSLFGLVIGKEYLYKPLRVTKIENDYVHLKGACNEYLNQIPHP